jgi:hypothetical protein
MQTAQTEPISRVNYRENNEKRFQQLMYDNYKLQEQSLQNLNSSLHNLQRLQKSTQRKQL